MEIDFKCTKCNKLIRVDRSTVLDRKVLWQDLLRIAEECLKPHIEAEHPNIKYVRIEPWPTENTTKEDILLLDEVYRKTGTHLWCNLMVGYENGRIYYLD